jgi:hypothetical protein
VAATPTIGLDAADAGEFAHDGGAAQERSSPASFTSTTARSGNGFAPAGGRGRSASSQRGADSRRPPRVNAPILAPGAFAPGIPEPSPEQDDGGTNAPIIQKTSSCTLAQMRRFIKSRPYVPVHELRRRFLIDGMEDEVSPVATGQRTLYVGLPPREAQFLGDLIRGGEVGCEMLLDPTSPGVVGVYPMRPVARQ